MSSQDEFQRVTEGIIKPIERLYGCQFDSKTIEDYVEDLSVFNGETLCKAMNDIRREQKRRPTLAHVYAACEKYKPRNSKIGSYSDTNSFHCTGHAEIMHPIQARQILESPIGQRALELGVARDLLNEYELKGRMEFDEEYLQRCKQGLTHAVEALAQAMRIQNPQAAAYESLWRQMELREKRLYAKYFKQKTNAQEAA